MIKQLNELIGTLFMIGVLLTLLFKTPIMNIWMIDILATEPSDYIAESVGNELTEQLGYKVERSKGSLSVLNAPNGAELIIGYLIALNKYDPPAHYKREGSTLKLTWSTKK